MSRLLVRQVAGVVLTALISSLVVFGSLSLAPGNPLAFLAGGRPLTPQLAATLRAEYHLNDPLPVRYWHWLIGLLHGDFGTSLVFHTSVSTILGPRIVTSLYLVTFAALLIVIVGLAIGIASGRGPAWLDRTLTVFTTIGLATPAFVAAAGLIALFAVQLGWFPVLGSGAGFLDRLHHLALPAIALAISSVAFVSRVTRTAVRQELTSEHVETARSRGLSEARILRRHVVRNAMIPIVTVTGLAVAGLVAGTVVVETAFGVNGVGSLLIQSVGQKDFAVVQAICLILVLAFAAVNALVDVAYVLIDPRVRVRST